MLFSLGRKGNSDSEGNAAQQDDVASRSRLPLAALRTAADIEPVQTSDVEVLVVTADAKETLPILSVQNSILITILSDNWC